MNVGDMSATVHLPEGEDVNEWLAVNVVDFKRTVSMLYSTITEFCTPQNCPVMRAGPDYKYLWYDGVHFTEPTELSAPEYIGYLMDWVEDQTDDETIFPSTPGVPFPDDFPNIVRNIMKRLFRVYAHCYHHHLENFKALQTDLHLNTSFKHFILFSKEFDLIPPDQLEPLNELVDLILQNK